MFRNTILQLSVPDRLRGRVNSVNIAVVSGGLACVAGVWLLGRALPELRSWTPPTDSVDPR